MIQFVCEGSKPSFVLTFLPKGNHHQIQQKSIKLQFLCVKVPSRPLSVIDFHGLGDRTIPYRFLQNSKQIKTFTTLLKLHLILPNPPQKMK